MSKESQLLKFYSNNLSDQLKSFVSPLELSFGLDGFFYTFLAPNGAFFQICNQPALAETYFTEGLYKNNPIFTHPDNYRGVLPIITDELSHPPFHESQEVINSKYGFKNFLCIPKFQGENVHVFAYSSSKKIPLNSVFLHNQFALDSFAEYFLENWKFKFGKLETYLLNIAEIVGPKYFKQRIPIDHSFNHQSVLSFGKKIGIVDSIVNIHLLSGREKECILLLLEGKTAVQIGEKLSISHRTATHYLNNIKMKLGCYSKTHLFDVLLNVKKLGLI